MLKVLSAEAKEKTEKRARVVNFMVVDVLVVCRCAGVML